MKKLLKNEEGSILISIILVLTIVLGFSITLTSVVMLNNIKTQRSYQNIIAMSSAEAAIEKTMWELNSGATPTCDPNCTLDNAYIEATVTTIDSENKEIVATAYVPSQTNYQAKKSVKIKISATPDTDGIALNYAIQAGTGGIDVGGSSEVQGNLYSNGDIITGGSAEVENPGNASAVGTITDTNRIKGTKTQGAPTVPLPNINIDMWKSRAESGGTITGNYSPPSTGAYTDLGPTKITGNLSMSSSNQKINLLGPLYIQGDLTVSGGSWKLDDSFGTYGTIVLVDGTIDISGGTYLGNSSGAYILFVSTNTANTKSSPAIKYTGSASGEKLALYATNGAMSLLGSGKVVAMTGKTLFISGNGEIEYEAGLASTEFAGGPGGVWKKKSWQQL